MSDTDKPIHFVKNWRDAVEVQYGNYGFDALCGLYVYDSKREPRQVTPHESGVTCPKCLKKLWLTKNC